MKKTVTIQPKTITKANINRLSSLLEQLDAIKEEVYQIIEHGGTGPHTTYLNTPQDFLDLPGDKGRLYRDLHHVLKETPQSRSDLADTLGIRVSTVCGRINELIKAKVVGVEGKKQDPITGKQVEVLVSLI